MSMESRATFRIWKQENFTILFWMDVRHMFINMACQGLPEATKNISISSSHFLISFCNHVNIRICYAYYGVQQEVFQWLLTPEKREFELLWILSHLVPGWFKEQGICKLLGESWFEFWAQMDHIYLHLRTKTSAVCG